MLTHADKFPLTDNINNMRQSTETILERIDAHPAQADADDITEALCRLTNAVLLLAEIQLAIGVQP